MSDSSAGQGSAMVESVGLSKFYGEFAAVQHISFAVPAGQVLEAAGCAGGPGSGQDGQVDLALAAGLQELLGGLFLNEERGLRELVGELPQQRRQKIGGDRRNGAEANSAVA